MINVMPDTQPYWSAQSCEWTHPVSIYYFFFNQWSLIIMTSSVCTSLAVLPYLMTQHFIRKALLHHSMMRVRFWALVCAQYFYPETQSSCKIRSFRFITHHSANHHQYVVYISSAANKIHKKRYGEAKYSIKCKTQQHQQQWEKSFWLQEQEVITAKETWK